MTKGELLHFLEPFSDDIKIVFLGHDGIVDFKAKYKIRSHPLRTNNGTLLERDKGIILLDESE